MPLKNCTKVRVLRMLRQKMYMGKPHINPSRVNTSCFKTLFRIHLFRIALQDFNVSAHSSRIACICLAQCPCSKNCNDGFLANCLGSTREYHPNLIHIPIHITCGLDMKAQFFCSECSRSGLQARTIILLCECSVAFHVILAWHCTISVHWISGQHCKRES